MKDEHPKRGAKRSLDERLSKHPHMYEQLHRITDEMEESIAKGATADEAEEMAIKQINELGRAMLSDWAQARHQSSVEQVRQEQPGVIRDSKKNCGGTPPSEGSS